MNKADRRRANEQQKQQKQQKQQQTGGGKTRASAQELKANATRPARQDSEGAAGGEEKGNATAALHQSVQARLPPIPAIYWPMQYPPAHVSPLFQRCKWSSRKARPS